MSTAFSKCLDHSCCRSSTYRHRLRLVNESSRCRFGRHAYIITMIVTLAFMMSIISCMDCQFILVRFDDDGDDESYYAGLWTYEGSDHECLAFSAAQSSEGGVTGTDDNYSKFIPTEDQNKGISQGSAVISAIFGFLAMCWSWFTVAKYAVEPPTTTIDDILLIFIAITFLAEAIKFGCFFNIELCVEDVWPLSKQDEQGSGNNSYLITRDMRERHHLDHSLSTPSPDENTTSWMQNATQNETKQTISPKSLDQEFRSASGCSLSRGSASSLSSSILFFVALVMMVGYAVRPKRKLRQVGEVDDESDLPSLALGSLQSHSVAWSSSIPGSSCPGTSRGSSSVAASTIKIDPSPTIFRSTSKSLDSSSQSDGKLDCKMSLDSGHGSLESSMPAIAQVKLGNKAKRSTFRQQLGKQRRNSRGSMNSTARQIHCENSKEIAQDDNQHQPSRSNSDRRLQREDSNRSAQERRKQSHGNSNGRLQREDSNRSEQEYRNQSPRNSDRQIRRQDSDRTAQEHRNISPRNSDRQIQRRGSDRTAQEHRNISHRNSDRRIQRDNSNRTAQEHINQSRQSSDRQIQRQDSNRSAGEERFQEARGSPNRHRPDQYHTSGIEDNSSRRSSLNSRRSRIRSSLNSEDRPHRQKPKERSSTSNERKPRNSRCASNESDTPNTRSGHERRQTRRRSRSRSSERDPINEKHNHQSIKSPLLSSTMDLNNEKIGDPLDIQRAQRMQRFAERSRRFHEFSSKNAQINRCGTIVQTIVTDRAVGPDAQVSRKLPPPHTRHCIKKIETDIDDNDMSAVTLDRAIV